VLIVAAACGTVGGGEYEKRGYQACAPIIAALAQYHEAIGEYPVALEELVPDYVEQIPAEVNGFPLHYTRRSAGQSYGLSFAFPAGAGAYCAYTPDEGWYCHVTW